MKFFPPAPPRQRWHSIVFCLQLNLILTAWSVAHPPSDATVVPQSGAFAVANSLLTNHPYLLELGNRDLLESIVAEADQPEKNADLEDRLVELLESVSTTINVAWGAEAKPGINSLGTVSLPGDRGGILFKVSKGQGPVSFKTSTTDMAWTEKYVPIPIASSGTTWSLLTFEHMPDGPNLLYAAFEEEDGSITSIPIQVTAPQPGRLRLTVLSDDTGEPTPAMIQLKWLFDGSLRVPENTVNLTSQFDSQARTRDRPTGSRQLDLPGITEGDYWIVRGPIDMMIPPGQWQISILRGLEHLQVIDTFKISSGKTVDKTYRPKRWVNMAEKGWYSGDDHVHAQVMSQTDADNLLTWALAEDVHLVNLLEMGDHERSYFQQRAFGKPGRIQNGDTILVPGQEDPRIRYLGHTIALNIPQRVRDTSKYFLHDWVYDRVHELGGLYGYAHINRELFSIHRNMALNIPKQKVDFVELLQFHLLGTRLYYEFLNLGYKITASAGSDVPWGDTMGEVRVYAFVPEKNFTSDAWFQALAEGHTFVTNGPMIEFTVNDAIPGDEINIGQNTRKLKVKARAWGHSDRLTPTRLEIVKHGEVVKSATGSSSQELQLDFELDPGMGCWLAARAYADNGSAAHTTPIYISRPNLRFWDYDHALSLIDQRMSSLIEIENMVKAVSDIQPTQASGEPTEGEGGALIGLWYGNANLTRPAGVDIFSLPAQRWPAASVRGGNWSAQWKGTLTLPSSVPESIRLFLDSSGPTSLSIDGKVIFSKEVRGEESVEIQLKPNTAHEVSLTYTNRRPPKSYLNLSWSAKGQDKQPVPAHWFAYDQQHRAAVRHAVGTEVDTFQLQEQADSLMDRVEGARGLYNDLRAQWRKESSKRGRQ